MKEIIYAKEITELYKTKTSFLVLSSIYMGQRVETEGIAFFQLENIKDTFDVTAF